MSYVSVEEKGKFTKLASLSALLGVAHSYVLQRIISLPREWFPSNCPIYGAGSGPRAGYSPASPRAKSSNGSRCCTTTTRGRGQLDCIDLTSLDLLE